MVKQRVYIEKKQEFSLEAKKYFHDFKNYLQVSNLDQVRVINLYDIRGGQAKDIEEIIDRVLYEPSSDLIYEDLLLEDNEKAFRYEVHKGAFNQREDSANEIVRKFLGLDKVDIKHSTIIILKNVSDEEFEKIKSYHINPIEFSQIDLETFTYDDFVDKAKKVEIIQGFIHSSQEDLVDIGARLGLAMDRDDLLYCQEYFKSQERNPSLTEVKLIDTYWSDHCRHTTFMTEITDIKIQDGKYKQVFQKAIEEYLKSKAYVYEDKKRATSLMDLATINMKEIKKKGLLDDKEETDEINAASIEIDVDVDGKNERYLLMFKNETHNHPTEIEPFGGAATCLGGAIRDPLSGRAYVYQAMRLTGAGDPRTNFEDTLANKLPQRKICQGAMEGFSSYGNEIGATTGYVKEFYHEGFLAKRMEVGALVGAVPKSWVLRKDCQPKDLIILVGGRTGRDGLGGAVGSSRVQTEETLEEAGAEVQKGNPILERKIMRLFRNPQVTRLIKKCNDFGAGGVSVAVGELADGLYIDLDKVPTKYGGLDGTDLALSESQERMAVVVDKDHVEEFLAYTRAEDVEATVIAEVTDRNRLEMVWQGDKIVDIDRAFLDTNGIRKKSKLELTGPGDGFYLDRNPAHVLDKSYKEAFMANMKDLNTASQKGLVERFDNTINGASVLTQLGGRHMVTPQEGMVAKIPVLHGETRTCSLMTYGYDPDLSSKSTFHGGYYAVIESIAKIVALGGDYRKIRLTFQEYFERLGEDPIKWGKPFSSLLGAFLVQKNLDIPSIGGKDSMSGSFEDLHVPPSLISFAVSYDKVANIISKEFKEVDSNIVSINLDYDEDGLIDFNQLKKNYGRIKDLADRKEILASSSVGFGGIGKCLGVMSLGNMIGCKIEDSQVENLYKPLYGTIILEISGEKDLDQLLQGLDYSLIGRTIGQEFIEIKGERINLGDLLKEWEEPLSSVYPIERKPIDIKEIPSYTKGSIIKNHKGLARPRVIIPVFTGTHGEYDMARSFTKAGGQVETYVFKTRTRSDVENSYKDLASKIKQGQILALPNGQIYGGEPEAGGKLLKIVLNNPYIREAIDDLLGLRDGLILGVGEGFIGLVKAGLIQGPTITSNKNAKFISTMVDVKLISNLSPWMKDMEVGQVYTVPIASGEARLVFDKPSHDLIERGQMTSQFVSTNPTGSHMNIEALTSPDGRILGTLTSIDRMDEDIYKNIEIKGQHRIFESGIKYFK